MTCAWILDCPNEIREKLNITTVDRTLNSRSTDRLNKDDSFLQAATHISLHAWWLCGICSITRNMIVEWQLSLSAFESWRFCCIFRFSAFVASTSSTEQNVTRTGSTVESNQVSIGFIGWTITSVIAVTTLLRVKRYRKTAVTAFENNRTNGSVIFFHDSIHFAWVSSWTWIHDGIMRL
jgi:hypothetical protein